MTDRDKALGPSPEDLIERLDRQAVNLATGYGRQLTTDLLSEASLALSQAQGRIGELEAELEATQAVRDEVSEELIAATFAKQAAEGLLKEAGEVIETFAIMANADTEYLPDEHVVSLTYDDSELDADLGGPNTLLGERYMRAFRRARAFLLKLTPGEVGGSSGVEALAHVAGATETDTPRQAGEGQ